MMHSYGAVETGVRDVHSVHHGVEDNEGSTLLGSEPAPKPREGHASMISCISNLSNTILGTGASFYVLLVAWSESG